ncbi:MAG: hypothetical protein CR217_06090 [Beijerinckiaceae bacterium]|nr:MAG: hypothetical protein CR217_06090 [Beijerinckiaceae bacterium]
MKRYLLAAALMLAATPAMACTDWKAIAAMDAALLSYDGKVLELSGIGATGKSLPYMETDVDRVRTHIVEALKDKCAPTPADVTANTKSGLPLPECGSHYCAQRDAR